MELSKYLTVSPAGLLYLGARVLGLDYVWYEGEDDEPPEYVLSFFVKSF